MEMSHSCLGTPQFYSPCSDWLGVITLTLSTVLASLIRAESSVNLRIHFSLQLSKKNPLRKCATIHQLRDIQAVCKP